VKSSGLDIIIGSTPLLKNDVSEGQSGVPAPQKTFRKDRRKNKRDRRQSVREGIYVTLSGQKERRVLRDRRKSNRYA
jgi:hypothetical protein